jgi:creatinine amidohydrolase/Fe(II)-dependent formamide hydrolase-like protein
MIHYRVLKEAIAQARKELGMETYFTEAPSVTIPGKEIPPGDYHAGAYETAWMEAYFPEEVDLEIAKTLKPRSGFDAPGYYGSPAKYDIFTREEIIQWQEDFASATADWIEAALKKKLE